MTNRNFYKIPTNDEEKLIYSVNGNRLTFDKKSGALISLRRPGCPEFIKTRCGLVDLAWPVNVDYDPLRLSPCYAYGENQVEFSVKDKVLTLHYTKLAQNIATPDDLPGSEGGTEVLISVFPDDDGCSIRLRAVVTCHASEPVCQVMFPNLEGLAAVSGEDEARFTTSLFHNNPYETQRSDETTRNGFFGALKSVNGQFYRPGGFVTDEGTEHFMGFRWFDYGSLRAGLSLYRRHWGWGPENMREMGKNDTYWVKVNQTDRTLRVCSMQSVKLKSGASYDSGDYVLTPHAGGWVKGIEAFKGWLKQNQKRVVPSPAKFKEMLGFRTVWFGTGYPKDPEDSEWRYSDLPRLADEAKAHGLDALSLWGSAFSDMPLTKDSFIPEYGGYDAFKKSLEYCNSIGVRLDKLVSHVQVWYKDAVRRGLPINMSWAQTIKAVPVACAPYMRSGTSHGMDDLNVDWWLEDSMKTLRFLRDEVGCPDIMWDQYILINGNKALENLINEYRRETYEKYPDALFYGESTHYCESDIDNCDSQWDWQWWEPNLETDFRPYVYAVETCRPNLNVDSSPYYAKYAFMDNLMLNVYPSKPGNINGSAMITDYPEFSEALKNIAAVRKKYIDFFGDGKNIGDCPLKKTCRTARVGFYTLSDKALALAVLGVGKHSATFEYDLSSYLDAPVSKMQIVNETGETVFEGPADKKGKVTLSGKPGDLFTVEFR